MCAFDLHYCHQNKECTTMLQLFNYIQNHEYQGLWYLEKREEYVYITYKYQLQPLMRTCFPSPKPLTLLNTLTTPYVFTVAQFPLTTKWKESEWIVAIDEHDQQTVIMKESELEM